MAFLPGNRRITYLVLYDNGGFEIPYLATLGTDVIVFLESGDQLYHGGEKKVHAVSAFLYRESDSEVCLSDARRAKEDHIFFSQNEFQVEQCHSSFQRSFVGMRKGGSEHDRRFLTLRVIPGSYSMRI